MKKKMTLLTVIVLICTITVPANTTENTKESQNCTFLSSQPSEKFFFVPLDSIQINRSSELSSQFSDSFFCQSANQLILHFLSQKHSPVTFDGTDLDVGITLLRQSLLNKDTATINSTADIIKEIAQKSGCELIIIPVSCILQHKMQTQNGWRDGRGGPSYERPVKNMAIARIQLQILDKNGALVCEHSSLGKETKPMLYSFLGKRVKITDIVSYSRKVYANPFIRALSEASKELVKH